MGAKTLCVQISNMKKSELYGKLIEMLPVEHPKGKDFYELLKESLETYVGLVKNLNSTEVSNKTSIVKSLEETDKKILSAVENISKGLHHMAYEDIKSVMKDKTLCFHTITTGAVFYRMRNNEKKEKFSRKDMFHIPLNKRGLVKTQRFSMPGYPCLYLGNSLAACWEEMHRPSLDNIMFSAFMLVRDAEFLSLILPQKEMWEQHLEDFINVIPIIIACMIQVDDYDNPYKVEYTIPQLITEWFISHRIEKDHYMLGIEYTSVHLNKDFEFPRSIYDNLALPVKDLTNKDFCSELKDTFVLTQPTSEEIERIKKGSGVSVRDMDAPDQIMENYKSSLFGELQGRIVNYSFEPLS